MADNIKNHIPSLLIILALLASAVPLSRSSAMPADAVFPGGIRADATFTALGVAWTVAGDTNLNSQMTLEYRSSGTATWLPGAPAVRADPNLIVDGAPLGLNYWAASALFLKPGATYDLRLTLTDPEGGGTVQVITAATRTELTPDSNGRQRYVAPGSGGGDGSQAKPFLGLQAAADAAQPGDTFHVAVGKYTAFQIKTSGTAGHPIAFIGPSGGGAVVDGAGTSRGVVTLGEYDKAYGYWIVSSLTIQNGGWGVDAQNTHDILLSHNTITNVDNGVLNRRDQNLEANQTIADNIIQGRLAWPGTGIPDQEGIDLRGTGNVVEYNRVRNFGDCISVNPSTGPSYANDVVGNDVSYCVDDGIEIDANQSNARAWRNRVMNARMGVSVQPIRGGPAYILRNEFFNLESDPIKMHNDTTGYWVVHNTGAMNGNAQSDDGALWRNAVFRDNLFLGTSYAFEFTTVPDKGFRDFDYDAWGTTREQTNPSLPLFKWNNVRYKGLAELQAIGVEQHGLLAHFTDLANAALPPSWDVAALPGSRDLRLVSSVPEIDHGTSIPNLDAPFVMDGKPDLGAFEFGQPLPAYGPRALVPDLSQSTKQVNRSSAATGQTLTYTIRLYNAGSPAAGIHLSDPLPAGATYQGGLVASAGQASYASGTISWNGDFASQAVVTITFNVTVDASVGTATVITNAAVLDDGSGGQLRLAATFIANGRSLYIPIVNR